MWQQSLQSQALTRPFQYNLIMQARHNEFILPHREATLTLHSHFDSGNLQHASLLGGKLVVSPALDPMHPQYSTKPSSKTFFHFAIHSTHTLTLSIVIQNMKILQYFANDEQFDQLYRPCLGKNHKKITSQPIVYEKTKLPGMKRVEAEGSYQLHFDLPLNQQQEVYVAYHFPYPLERSQRLLQQAEETVKTLNQTSSPHLYLANELLIESLEGRPVQLVTLTDRTQLLQEREERFTRSLFPYHQLQLRPHKFVKPYLLITCRVHPGQTSGSFALEGMLQFLLSGDPAALTLLNSFVFLIVPVINPDGVFHNTYRMDTQGHNLNRFYNNAQSHKQPAVFAVQTLANYYHTRIAFSIDLHSHPHPLKGTFLYGNSLPTLEEQTESQLFAKLLGQLSDNFNYNACNFTSLQMNSRDTNELLTKDGSARVQLYKTIGMPFAFTVELGHHGGPMRKEESGNLNSEARRVGRVLTIQDYQQDGKNILLALLKLYQLNAIQTNRQPEAKIMQQLREELCKELVDKEERFRLMDSLIFKKVKHIHQLIHEQYYAPFLKRYPFLALALKDPKEPSKKPQAPALSEETCCLRQTSVQPKALSMNFKHASKTLDAAPMHSNSKYPVIKSFKSSIQPRQTYNSVERRQPSNSLSIRPDSFRFAKQLNLHFNPFPDSERKKIYNLIGSRKSTMKNQLLNELQTQREATDLEPIDVASQLQAAETTFKETETDKLRTDKLYYITHQQQEDPEKEQMEENSLRWEYNKAKKIETCRDSIHRRDPSKEEDRWEMGKWERSNHQWDSECPPLLLPRIPKAEPVYKAYTVELQLQKHYDHKYQLQANEQKYQTVEHRQTLLSKPGLRCNSLRMKSLLKSNK